MNFPDLTKRLITSIISLGILACVLIFAYVEVVKWFIALFAAGISGLGIWEFCCLSKLNSKSGLTELLISIGFLTVLGFFVATLDQAFVLLPFVLIFCGIICIFLYHFDKISSSIESIAKSTFAIFYVAIPIGLILQILYLSIPCTMGHEGRIWFLYLLGVTKITDIGAYFGGRLIGKRKLAPEISPGKTMSGATIGFISAVLFSFLFHFIGRLVDSFQLTWIESLWLGALLGFLGQIGDLGESLLKRDADVKDSNSLPGLGGMLDMLDSLLFTTPVVYFFLYIF